MFNTRCTRGRAPKVRGPNPDRFVTAGEGSQPTVTDAILILGLLSPDSEFAGRGFSAWSGRESTPHSSEELAGPLSCSVEEAAFDCWRLVNANMTQAVRRTTAGRGIDPRSLSLLAYGGNGPVFAAIQAEDLGIERVLIPQDLAGILCAGCARGVCPPLTRRGPIWFRPLGRKLSGSRGFGRNSNPAHSVISWLGASPGRRWPFAIK